MPNVPNFFPVRLSLFFQFGISVNFLGTCRILSGLGLVRLIFWQNDRMTE